MNTWNSVTGFNNLSESDKTAIKEKCKNYPEMVELISSMVDGGYMSVQDFADECSGKKPNNNSGFKNYFA